MKNFVERRTGAKPRTVGGVTFFCWHLGICQYEWRNESIIGNITIWSPYGQRYFHACLDTDGYIRTDAKLKRFRTFENAARAATKLRETRS